MPIRVGLGGHWRVGMDELMNKNLPYFVLSKFGYPMNKSRHASIHNKPKCKLCYAQFAHCVAVVDRPVCSIPLARLLQRVGGASSIVFIDTIWYYGMTLTYRKD